MSLLDRVALDAPLPVIGFGLLIATAAAREFGAVAHHWLPKGADSPEQSGSDEGHILTAVLGLLALLVAFTFGLALDRHETRRALVVAEGDALSTSYLRTSLLDDPTAMRSSLRDYARGRLAYGLATGKAQLTSGVRATALQTQVWRDAMTAVAPLRTTPTAGLVLTPLNEAFDIAAQRKAALAARVPTTVLTVLALYAVASAAMMGYAVAGAGARHRLASLVMFALLALALVLIVDLDRAQGGTIRVPQTAVADALAAMTP